MDKFVINSNDKVLIVSPHADDETIGCGGLLAMYGNQCDVLLMTDGRYGKPENSNVSDEEIISTRKEEFSRVMDFFKVNNYFEWNYCDSTICENITSIKKKKFLLKEYSYVFLPNRMERHKDHAATYKAIISMCKYQRVKANIIQYEVWSPLSEPNCYLEISEFFERKLDALRMYKSQLQAFDYIRICEGINTYRGASMNANMCEAYFSIKRVKDAKRYHFRERFKWLIIPLWKIKKIIIRK